MSTRPTATTDELQFDPTALAKPRPSSPPADEVLGVPIHVLDHGLVRLVDYMGNDDAVVQAARVSHGKGTKKVHEDNALIAYLMRHGHWSPFQMVEIKAHIKAPIFVFRQWVRHTGDQNEISGRYSVLDDHFYLPDGSAVAVQSKDNKQGRGEALPDDLAEEFRRSLAGSYGDAYGLYKRLVDAGMAREIARIVLPVATYSELYWKQNLRDALHLLRQRLDPHAQWEVRRFAEAYAMLVQRVAPVTYAAAECHIFGAVALSARERDYLAESLDGLGDGTIDFLVTERGFGKREAQEFLAKFRVRPEEVAR